MDSKEKRSKHEMFPERYKNVVLSFVEPDALGTYGFYIPKVQLSDFKRKLAEAGGVIKKETPHRLFFALKGEDAEAKVFELSLPFMYRY